MDFPEQTSTRRFLLTGDHVRIGRRSTTRGIDAEIDLSGALEDTGVSHRHTVLMRQPEGNWALVDLDSTNGTFLNADQEPIPANHPLALSDGDQIHLGGWTTLTMERLDPAIVARLEAESRPSKDTRSVAGGRRPWEDRPPRTAPARGLRRRGPHPAAKTRAVLALLALRVGAADVGARPRVGSVGRRRAARRRDGAAGYIASLRKLLPDGAIETTPRGATGWSGPSTPSMSSASSAGARGGIPFCFGSPRRRRGRAQPGAGALARRAAARPGRRARRSTTEVVGLVERQATAEEDLFEARLQLGDHQNLVADLGRPWTPSRCASAAGPSSCWPCTGAAARSRPSLLPAPSEPARGTRPGAFGRAHGARAGDRLRARRAGVDRAHRAGGAPSPVVSSLGQGPKGSMGMSASPRIT